MKLDISQIIRLSREAEQIALELKHVEKSLLVLQKQSASGEERNCLTREIERLHAQVDTIDRVKEYTCDCAMRYRELEEQLLQKAASL